LKTVLAILFSFVITDIFAQNDEVKREIKYTAEIGAILSTKGEMPFWLRANQYGIVPSESPILTVRGSIISDYKKAITKEDQYKLSKFDWGYGLNVVGNVGKENQVLISEAYIKAKYGAFEIYAGRRKEIVGLVDTTLSSGSYIWSGNALPMPKIQISTTNFVPLGFTKGFLSFKGNYAHGWFENYRTDVKDFYLHQKSLYFRLGKPNWKFRFYGGFNHQVQWGGTLLYLDPNNQYAINGKVGSSFSDYINVITGRSLATVGDTTKNGGNDAFNRSGNHLGTLDLGFEINTNKFQFLLYRQNIYEDGSLAYLSNISDGLNGISFNFINHNDKKIEINKIVLEYLSTMSQGGGTGSDNLNARLRGEDNYFNNAIYREGWTYNGNIIGTAFINRLTNTNPLINNRLRMLYFSLKGRVKQVNVIMKISQSNNFGTYFDIIEWQEFSSQINLEKRFSKLSNTFINVRGSYTFHKVGSNSVGAVNLSLRKYW
jgi:hypothetical protein